MKIRIKCDGIMCENEMVLDGIDGWWSAFDDAEYGGESKVCYCPNCFDESQWFDKQCPGCVGYPKDCSLFQSFAFSSRRTISEKELSIIECGRCPYRTNGTFSFSREEGFNDIDLSEKASTKDGLSVANAIRKYIEVYPTK